MADAIFAVVLMALMLSGAELVRMSCRRQLLKPMTARPVEVSGTADIGH